MFNMITTTFEENNITLDNCVAIALDNTNANMGAHNSLRTHITAANPSVYVSGCVCHILHNAGLHGTHTLEVRPKGKLSIKYSFSLVVNSNDKEI